MRTACAAAFVVLAGACDVATIITPDASASDAGDAAGDAAACGSFCAHEMGASFCCDFDEDAGFSAWTPANQGIASASVQMGDNTSCYDALVVDVPQEDAATSSYTLTTSVPSGPTGQVVVALDVKMLSSTMGTGNGVDDVDLLTLRASTSGAWEIRIAHTGLMGWALKVVQNNSTQSIPISVPPISWSHMVLTVTFSTSATGSVVLSYQNVGGSMATTPAVTGANTDSLTAPVQLTIGVSPQSATTHDWKVMFDSVVLTAK